MLFAKSNTINSEYIGVIQHSGNAYYVNGISLSGKKRKFSLKDLKWNNFQVGNPKDRFLLESGDIIHIFSDGTFIRRYTGNTNDLTIHLTDCCNQSCLMCPQSENFLSGNNLYCKSINYLLTKAMITNKPRNIGISGGEPFCQKNELVNIVNLILDSTKSTMVNILTNGVLLAEKRNWLDIEAWNKSRVSFHIPLYSDSERIHNHIVQRNNFYKAIRGIYNLAYLKFPIEIRFVVTKLNYNRLPQWAYFISQNFPFVQHVAIMGIELEGKTKESINASWIGPEYFMEKLEQVSRIFGRARINFSIYNYPLCFLSEKLRTYYSPSISDWKCVYADTCEQCSAKDVCCGMFNSAAYLESSKIVPISCGECKNETL